MMDRNFIIEYQEYRGLKPDGIAGMKTLRDLMSYLEIRTFIQIAHFFSVCKYESGNFIGSGRENLNYSARALVDKFPRHFKSIDVARVYEHNPIKIANYIYANRMGNNRYGDGYDFRGVGAIQLTGRYIITECMEKLDINPGKPVDALLEPEHYFKSAKFYFDKHNLWNYCIDTGLRNVLTIARGVNLGDVNSSRIPFGMEARYAVAKQVFDLLSLH